VQHLPYEIGYLAATAAVGGIIGAELGSRRLAPPSMRLLLSAVLVIAGFKLIFTKGKPPEELQKPRRTAVTAPASAR
jgi:uncharacterized membrane protein YfcA